MSETRIIHQDDVSKVTEDQRDEVVRCVRDYTQRNGLSNNYIAKALGIGTSTVSQVLNGKYMGDWRQITLDLDRWLDDEVKKDAAPKPVEFVWTGVATEIRTVAETAIILSGIGMVYGESGIGKTLALRAIQEDKPGAIFVSAETIGGTATAIIEAIGRAMRSSPGPRYASSRYWFESIKRALRGSGRLLIIDQVHKLCGADRNESALFALCDLQDATGIPMLWCGTIDLVAHLEKGEGRGRETLAQIRSRIAICRDLHARTSTGGDGNGEPLFTIEDVRKVYSKNKMRLTRDAERFLVSLANLPGSGGLRTCTNVVRMATRIFEDKAVSLSVEHLTQMRNLLATRQVIRRTQEQLEAQPIAAKAG